MSIQVMHLWFARMSDEKIVFFLECYGLSGLPMDEGFAEGEE